MDTTVYCTLDRVRLLGHRAVSLDFGLWFVSSILPSVGPSVRRRLCCTLVLSLLGLTCSALPCSAFSFLPSPRYSLLAYYCVLLCSPLPFATPDQACSARRVVLSTSTTTIRLSLERLSALVETHQPLPRGLPYFRSFVVHPRNSRNSSVSS